MIIVLTALNEGHTDITIGSHTIAAGRAEMLGLDQQGAILPMDEAEDVEMAYTLVHAPSFFLRLKSKERQEPILEEEQDDAEH